MSSGVPIMAYWRFIRCTLLIVMIYWRCIRCTLFVFLNLKIFLSDLYYNVLTLLIVFFEGTDNRIVDIYQLIRAPVLPKQLWRSPEALQIHQITQQTFQSLSKKLLIWQLQLSCLRFSLSNANSCSLPLVVFILLIYCLFWGSRML